MWFPVMMLLIDQDEHDNTRLKIAWLNIYIYI